MLDVRLKPVETLLFRSDVVAIGKFRCPATNPLFFDSGPCSHHTFVFPRTVTRIRLDDGRSFVATPASVVFYNQDQLYTRSAISPIDASDWYTVSDDVLGELIDIDDWRRPFRASDAPVESRAFLAQRRIFDALNRGDALDALEVEDTVLRVLRTCVAQTFLSARPPHADAVEQVKSLLAQSPTRALSLRSLARSVSLSPFALCRAFRAATGASITHYRHALRLRLALDRLRDKRADLTDLALSLGYASHSHFTATFRRHFGVTPSAWRAKA